MRSRASGTTDVRRRRAPAARASLGLVSLLACSLVACARVPPPDPAPAPEAPPDPVETPVPSADLEQLDAEREARDRVLRTGELPPIPPVDGPLRIRVTYPVRGQRLPVADSNFIFGSVGTGEAALWIGGEPVPVEPNGAFLAWLPVPVPLRGDTARYRLEARRGSERDSLHLPIRLPPTPYVGRPGTAWLDTAALRREPERWTLPDETLPFAVRGAPGLRVWVEAGEARFPLREDPDPDAGATWAAAGAPPRAAVYRGEVAAARLAAAARARRPLDPSGCREAGCPSDSLQVALLGTDGTDTVRLAREISLRVLDPADLPVGRLRTEPDPVQGQSGVVVGRPTPIGPYRWLLPPESRIRVDGRIGDRLRAQLAPDLPLWFVQKDVQWLAPGTAPPRSVVRDLRVEPGEEALILRVPLRTPLPAAVTQPDERTLALTVYGALGETSRVASGPSDELLESVSWEQLPGARYRVVLRVRQPVWGYRLSYERGQADRYEGPRASDADGASGRDPILRLEVRRPPPVDRRRPLQGRRIAIDPGHPGGGSYGPTGLYEGDANLAVAVRLAGMLREEGAEPLLVRLDTLPVGLYERVERAERGGAELLVSIHNNALPDGIRPFGEEGTSTYYHHPHARPLAESVQEGMLEAMGLRDLGVVWGDLAVARTTWMPAVLTEGAFMMIPRHEAALRTPEFQELYARGVLEGLERFLRARAEPQERED